MNAHAFASNAYQAHARTLKTPRDIEYAILSRVTAGLQSARDETGPTAFPALAAAVVENNRLWTAFAVDLVHPENRFPQQLRAQLIYLAEFVAQHSDKVLNGTAEADILIDVNLSVMRGLSGKVDVT